MSRAIFTDMLMRVLNEEKSWFAKFIDAFYKLSESHQKGFLQFFVEEVGSDKWIKKLTSIDRSDLLLDIMFYYSGYESLKQPCKKEFKKMIGAYIVSDMYVKKDRERKRGPSAFVKALEDIDGTGK